MRILILLPFLPYPLTSGGAQAMYNGIEVVKNDAEVFVIYNTGRKDRSEKLRREFQTKLGDRVSVYYFVNKKSIATLYRIFKICVFKLSRRLFKKDWEYRGDKFQAWCKPFPTEYIEYISDFIISHSIDIVQFEMLGTLPAVLNLPSSVKKIFVHHEIGFVCNNLRIREHRDNLYLKASGLLSKLNEISLLNLCDGIITLSETDTEKLKEAGVRVPIYTSMAVVNTPISTSTLDDTCHILSFVGPESHNPNRVGIQWFLEKCWNELLKIDPDYQLHIIGNWSEPTRKKLSTTYRNIKFLGFVDNLTAALQNTIMIVPITIGSGIRMKILEASAAGIPFVSTKVGAEGLPFKSGANCFITDDESDFVKSILALKDYSLRLKFANEAKAIVKENFSLNALKLNRLSIYEDVLNNHQE